MDILQSVNLDHECHFCFHFSAFDEVRKLVADGLYFFHFCEFQEFS